MKNFRLEVPEGETHCDYRPFYEDMDNILNNEITRKDICQFLRENKHCFKYDFSKMHIWED